MMAVVDLEQLGALDRLGQVLLAGRPSLLQAGKVDAYASDKLLLLGAQINRADAFVMLPDDLSIEPYAIAMPRGDWALRLAVNTGLAQIYRGGQIVAVFRKWFDEIGLRPGALLGAAYTLGGLSE